MATITVRYTLRLGPWRKIEPCRVFNVTRGKYYGFRSYGRLLRAASRVGWRWLRLREYESDGYPGTIYTMLEEEEYGV